tara:strand:- start:734 stop:979 length:246 start_codon:yes stop_codon:yes gene_type:complete
MNKRVEEIQRVGERLIKYKADISETKHLFCYKLANKYYSFIMSKGLLVDYNGREKISDIVKGTNKPKYFNQYYNSSLNEWY